MESAKNPPKTKKPSPRFPVCHETSCGPVIEFWPMKCKEEGIWTFFPEEETHLFLPIPTAAGLGFRRNGWSSRCHVGPGRQVQMGKEGSQSK